MTNKHLSKFSVREQTPSTRNNAIAEINGMLEQARKEGAHVLSMYTIRKLPPLQTYSIRWVKIDPGQGVTYEIPGSRGMLGLHRPAMNMLARAAGIQWVPERCRRIDDGRNPRYVEYEAVGRVQDQDGVWTLHSARKAINLDVIERELRNNYREKVKRKQADPNKEDEEVYKNLLQFAKHMLARAETGAKNRVIEQILGLKKAWRPEELQKPFVVAATVPDLDPTNESDREFLRRQAYGAEIELYGSARRDEGVRTSLPGQSSSEDEAVLPDDVMSLADDYHVEIDEGAHSPPQPAPHPQNEPSSEEHLGSLFDDAPKPDVDHQVLDFECADRAQKIEMIYALMRQKALSRKPKGNIEEWNEVQLEQLFHYLKRLPDKKETVK